MKVIHIKDDIYQANIYLIPKCEGPDIEKWMAKKHGSKYQHDKFCEACHYLIKNNNTGTMHHFLIFNELKNTPKGISDLFHEVLHLCFSVLGEAGIQYGDETSEEAYTYYVGYITESILNKVTK